MSVSANGYKLHKASHLRRQLTYVIPKNDTLVSISKEFKKH